MTKDEAIDMLNAVIDSLSHPETISDLAFSLAVAITALESVVKAIDKGLT